MIRLLSFIVLFGIAATAAALDKSDAGNYAVIHRDGHVTDFTFFVSLTGDEWNIEQMQPDGSWSSVTCTRDCVLHESKAQDIARFFPANTLREMTPSCVHNTAFAFCSYTLRAHPERKDYKIIALVTPQPTPISLKRLEDGWKDQQGRPVPNSDAQKAVDGFGGLLIVTSDADWEEKWNTQPDTVPHFNQAKTVGMGKKIFALTFFTNPQLDSSGDADITCDIDMTRPDGSSSFHQNDVVCFKGALKGKPYYLYLSAPVVEFIGEQGDPFGEWRVSITLKDNIRHVSLPLKTSFVLQ
jgi:hypothetical protein